MLRICLFLLASAVVVHAAPNNLQERFDHFDTNNDGVISGKEMDGAAILRTLDLDGNGALTPQEALRALRQKRQDNAAPSSPAPVVEDASLKEQPQLLKPAEHGVGHLVEDAELLTRDGKAVRLNELAGDKPLVLFLFSATCPISNKLGPEIARLEKDYADGSLNFFLLNAVPQEDAASLEEFARTHQLQSPVLEDAGQMLLRHLQAATTTEVFVLDASRTLVYRGAINDQYGLGYTKEKPQQQFLRQALDAVLRHEAPLIAATTVPGCTLDLKTAATDAQPVAAITYHHQIARIMQNHCVECHRQDGIAPFGLETLADVTKHAGMIRRQVERGAMPPWFAAHEGPHESPWSNDRSLTEQDKTDLLAWLNSDRPAGDPALAPQTRQFARGWTIAQPDVVLQIPEPFSIKAEGVMPYQHAVVGTDFPEDRWVSAYEIQPTAPGVVHHVIVRVHPKGSKVTGHREGADGFWAAYVPGNASRIMPEGFAKKLPAGATLSFQIHYTPNGRATEDQIKIGLKFTDKPPLHEVHVAAVAQPKLLIPPYAASHTITKDQRAPFDMMITGFMPHMHVRGAAFKYEITYPDQRRETLLDIPEYDFNWQLQYNYKQPRFIPRGSVMTITAVFDNSAGNPANPDPSKTVRWGSQTYDEMMIGYLEHYTPLPQNASASR